MTILRPQRTMRCAIVAATITLGRAASAADSQPIDIERSTLTVHVFKAGLFSAFADNHVIRAPMTDGRLSDEGTLSVEIAVQAARLTVLDPGLSSDKRAEVQARMQGPEVLDSARYPEIRFASTRIEPAGANEWRVTGDLSLHGVTRSLTFSVARHDAHYRGGVSVRQREFGIQPISIVGGTVKVKDELRIEFDIVQRREHPPAGI